MIIDIQVRTEAIQTETVQGSRERLKDLYISYFDKDGEVAFKELPLAGNEAFTWELVRPGEKAEPGVLSWDLKQVRKARSLRLNRYRVEEILSKRINEVPEVLEFNIPKKFVIDIETEVTDGFPDPESAQNKVTAISIVNCSDKRVTVLGLKDMSDDEVLAIEKQINEYFSKYGDKWLMRYVKFESEYDMLYTFFNKLIHKMPFITGWNILGFDWPYLVNRCDKLKIDPSSASVSKWLMGRDRLPQHRLIVDYLDIVKKWDRVIKIKENYKLDYIAEQATGLTKIKYNGSFRDLYEDFNKFVYYNAVDSILVHYIDKKLNTLTTLFKLAEVDRVEINRVFSPVSVQEALMGREFLKRGKVFVDIERSAEQKHFEGAYVKEPVIGMHAWVTCYDFASLYPNTMMQFNISPESFRGKSLAKMSNNETEIVTSNGNIFDATEDSVLRTILKDLYSKRKATKKKMLDINKEIAKLESHIK